MVSIKIDTIPASPGSSIVYIYYGNPSATSESSGDNAYFLFDDFDIPLDTNKWQVLAGTVYTDFSNLIVSSPNAMVTTKNSIPLNCEITYSAPEPDNSVEATIRDIKLTKETTPRNFCRWSMRNIPPQKSMCEGVLLTFVRTSPNPVHIIRHTLNGNLVFISDGITIQTQASLRASTESFSCILELVLKILHFLIH